MLFASDVNVPTDLSSALNPIASKGTSGVNSVYSGLKQRQNAEAGVRGMPASANSYGAGRLATGQGLSQGNLESTMGGILGNAGYNDALSQRDYNQKLQLAQETADLNRPSLLDEIFQGIGGVGKTASSYYGMKNQMNRNNSGGGY